MALPWILIQYGPNDPTNGTITGPPPWVLIGFGTDGGAVTPPVTVGTVGGSRKHHAPGGRHFPRREWEALLEVIRLEKVALEAPAKAKKALAAVAEARRTAANVAAELRDLADAQQLARLVVAAERAAKSGEAIRQANAAMVFARELQARLDEEDDDDIMLMASAL